MSGRETARLACISLRAAQLSLENLERLKIVKRQAGGREHLFTLNRQHFITNEIISKIFASEEKFKTSLFKEIISCLNESADSIILFGSVARREETLQSDLDICIVYSKNKNKIEKNVSLLRDSLYEKYGVTLAPFYVSGSNFKIKAKKNKSPVNEIIQDGKVLFGTSIKELING